MQILDTSRLLADVFFWGNKNIFTQMFSSGAIRTSSRRRHLKLMFTLAAF
jgi:hypothetical protein